MPSSLPIAGKALASLLLFCLTLLPALAGGTEPAQLDAYVERHENGWIDWKNGLIYGIGRAFLDQNRNNRPLTQGAAAVVASGNIVKLAAGLHLDDKGTLESLGGGKISINLQAFIRDRQIRSDLLSDQGRAYFEVVKVAEIKGISGLTAKLLDYFAKDPSWRDLPLPKRAERAAPEQEGAPWLLIDARHLPPDRAVQPALFPKIVRNDGQIIYSVQGVDEAALVQRGMISYVTTAQRRDQLLSTTALPATISSLLTSLLQPAAAWAETIERPLPNIPLPGATKVARPERKKRGKYLLVDAQNVHGLTKTNLVVSAEDAKAMKEEDASSQILKKCRVVVIVSSPVGGIEGSLETLLAGLQSW